MNYIILIGIWKYLDKLIMIIINLMRIEYHFHLEVLQKQYLIEAFLILRENQLSNIYENKYFINRIVYSL